MFECKDFASVSVVMDLKNTRQYSIFWKGCKCPLSQRVGQMKDGGASSQKNETVKAPQ